MVSFSISALSNLYLYHIHACHPSFLSLLSILLALLYNSYIQTAQVLLFPLAHTHNNHHHTSMPSFRSLLQVDILPSPSISLTKTSISKTLLPCASFHFHILFLPLYHRAHSSIIVCQPPVFSHKYIYSIPSYPFSSLGSPFHLHSTL